MNILITYSSLTGNTKKLAEGIFKNLPYENKEIKPIKEVSDISNYDFILVGFWTDKGTANTEAIKFLETIENKNIGIFGTLGFWSDSKHAFDTLENVEKIVIEKNEVFVRYICQGALSEKIIEKFKSFPEGDPHAITPKKLRRYEIAKKHPSEADINSASELIIERLEFENV